MSMRRGAGIVPVIGWTLPAFVLAPGLSAARADERAELRANQELLQLRVGFLRQADPLLPRCPHAEPLWRGQGLYRNGFRGVEHQHDPQQQRRRLTNGYIPRFRQGYATLGGLLMGQTNGTFVDNDADPELLDFGGTTGSTGRSRLPMVRYTYPLPYGMSIAVAAENPDADFAGPFGAYGTDTNQIPTEASCAALTQTALTTTTTNAATNITNACLGNPAFFNAAQNLAPDFVLRWRIEQPWGHLQAGGVVRDLTLNDGEFLSRSWIGYGGALSGNFFTWGKDNLTWSAAAGE